VRRTLFLLLLAALLVALSLLVGGHFDGRGLPLP
jgi:hypothetical protein